jgi:hypothetical protein
MVVRKSDFRRSEDALKSVDARRFDPFADPLERNVTAADVLRVAVVVARELGRRRGKGWWCTTAFCVDVNVRQLRQYKSSVEPALHRAGFVTVRGLEMAVMAQSHL